MYAKWVSLGTPFFSPPLQRRPPSLHHAFVVIPPIKDLSPSKFAIPGAFLSERPHFFLFLDFSRSIYPPPHLPTSRSNFLHFQVCAMPAWLVQALPFFIFPRSFFLRFDFHVFSPATFFRWSSSPQAQPHYCARIRLFDRLSFKLSFLPFVQRWS